MLRVILIILTELQVYINYLFIPDGALYDVMSNLTLMELPYYNVDCYITFFGM